MENETPKTYNVIELCLLAGKLMLESGAETNRVEDTMMRIAASYGIGRTHSYVTPTGIIFSVEGQGEPTKLIRISDRTTDLHKVSVVNSISREISTGTVPVEEAFKRLKEVETDSMTYPVRIQVLAASIASGCFLFLSQGGWSDFFPALITSGIGFSCFIYFHRIVRVKFLAEFLASLIITLIAYAFVTKGLGNEIDKIIIGSLMPLVPGLLITNAVRDLMSGHLISGLAKGADAFLTAFAIGAGVAAVIFTVL
jgi:uncharacterized membrane protein YjjP (DUF1212 family)